MGAGSRSPVPIALDSRLLGIAEDAMQGGELALLYSFAVAGRIPRFHTSINGAAVPSIAAPCPAAQGFEDDLQQRLGLVFLAAAAGE